MAGRVPAKAHVRTGFARGLLSAHTEQPLSSKHRGAKFATSAREHSPRCGGVLTPLCRRGARGPGRLQFAARGHAASRRPPCPSQMSAALTGTWGVEVSRPQAPGPRPGETLSSDARPRSVTPHAPRGQGTSIAAARKPPSRPRQKAPHQNSLPGADGVGRGRPAGASYAPMELEIGKDRLAPLEPRDVRGSGRRGKEVPSRPGPPPAVSSGRGGEPDSARHHEGFDKTGADGLREPRHPGLVPACDWLLPPPGNGKQNKAVW